MVKNSVKILVVDDDPLIVAAARRVLESAGYETLEAQDGLAALEVTRTQRPDLVLLDVNMPVMSGFEACRQIKADPALAGTFVIILSSTSTDSDSHVDGLNMGADDYISRPIPNRELLAHVQAMLRIRTAENALRISAEQWSSTFNTVADVIFLTDADFTILKCNRAAEQTFQQPAEGMIGKKCYHVVHDTRAPITECPLKKARECNCRQTFTLSSGERWLEAKVDPIFDDSGHFTGTVHIVSDITERKRMEQALRESEDKFKYFFDYSVVGKSITLPSGEIQVNKAFCEMLGFPPEELQNKSWQEITHPDDIEITQQEINALLSGKKDAVRFIKRYFRKDGSAAWTDVSSSLRRGEDGKPLYFITTLVDITARREAEVQIQYQASLLANVSDATLATDRQFHIQYWNAAAEKQYGWKPAEVLGCHFTNFIQPQYLGDSKKTVIRKIAQDGFWSGELLHNRRDGTLFPVQVTISEVRNAEGQITGYVVINRDITERRNAEEKLKGSEASYRTLAENLPGIVYRVNLWDGGNMQFFNAAVETLTGFKAEELVTGEICSIEPLILPEDRQAVLETVKRAIKEVSPFEVEYRLRRKDAEIRHFVERGSVVKGADDKLYIDGVIFDVTERKQAEEILRETSTRLTHMLANSPTVIYALKFEGYQAVPVWISENIEAILGFSAQDALRPEWWPEQIHPQDRLHALTSLEYLLADFYQHEYRFLRKDGREVWLHDEHRLLRDTDNKPYEIIGSWTDITERKQAEQALKEYSTRLEAEVAERTCDLQEAQGQLIRQEKLAVLGQLAGGVGHELRNPLAVINNAVYYLKLIQPDAGEKVKEYLSMIEKETNTADRIITDLLGFARIKSVEQESVAVPELVQRVLERFPAPASIQVRLNIPASLPPVFADLHQVEQVLGNLVVNACQAMPKGGKLTLSAKKKAGMVGIAVKDTGVGILPENMPKLFEPLFTTKIKGIGLGLAVSRKLAEANGGRIEVQSEPGKGSTFTVYLAVSKETE